MISTFVSTLVKTLDGVAEFTGRSVAWLALLLSLVTVAVVALRYGLQKNTVALQELAIYFPSLLFLLGASYALKHQAHVRVDIFYRHYSELQKAWVNAVGCVVFLLPICGLLFFLSLSFVAQSWLIAEKSAEPGGLPALYLLKALIPLGALSLFLQGLAETLRATQLLMAATDD